MFLEWRRWLVSAKRKDQAHGERAHGNRQKSCAGRNSRVLGLILAIGSVPIAGFAVADPCLESHTLAKAERAGASGRADKIPEMELTLRVYNYAKIDAGLLARSEKVASAIFRNAGVETVWMDCALSEEQIREYPACQTEMGTTDLVVRILPRRMAENLRMHGEPLGTARLCPETEAACELNVFFQKVDELGARGYRADFVLGHVFAHEVGHVLMGAGHSDTGIMRGEWSRSDLQRISWGISLEYTSFQAEELRAAALKRAAIR
jgi:hypothetical protein